MLSVPVIVMASISFYAGLYHLLIYIRGRHFREHLAFSILCFTVVLYDVFCVGLYSVTSTVEGAHWQKLQFIALALFVPAFLWFVSIYTNQKPGALIYAYSLFYLVAFLVQLIDRSDLTFLVGQPAIKDFTFLGHTITYNEVALGPFSVVQSFMGLIASAFILVMSFRYYKRGYTREAIPLILATVLMYMAGFHDTLVGNGVYRFIYLMEYAYLATLLMMTWSLSNSVIEAAVAKEELRKREEWFRSLVETTSDWVWEVDANGRYTYASPRVRDLLGYEPQEVLGRTPFDFMSSDGAQEMSRLFQTIIQDQRMFERLENTNLRKDGQPVVLETSGIPYFNENGELLGYRGIDRDVTERKRAEEALHQSQQMLRTVLGQFPGMVYWKDRRSVYMGCNQAFATTAGLVSPAEIVGKTDFDLPWGEMQANANHTDDNKVMESGKSHIGVLEPRHQADDSLIWLDTAKVPLVDDDGNVIGIVGTSRDITEQVRTLHVLQETEFFLNRSQQVGQIGSYKFDVRSGFWESSSSLDEILGIDGSYKKDVQGWLNIVAPEDRDMMRDHMMQHVLRDRQRFEKEYRIVRPIHGDIRWVFGLGELEFDNMGNPTRIIGTIQDITERRQIEDKLRVSEERLQQAIRVSNIGIFDHDHIADIIYWSPDLRRSYNIGMEEPFTLSDFLKHIHPDDLQQIGQAVQRAHDPAGNGVFDVEYRFIRRDGEIRWFAAKSQTFFGGEGTSKHPIRTIGALIDITERKGIEEERETLIEKLEAKNAELERFTYTVSHDLKSPLVTIKGFLGFIEKDATSGNMDRLKGDLRRISDAVEKMRLLLGDLLELSRVGRFSRPSEIIPFEELVKEAVNLVEGSIREHNVTVKLQPGLPAVYGDRQRLLEVLQNLLDNATKFMGDQSDPYIEIGQSGEEGDSPVFYVRDNGIGFSPEFREHIFGLFNKLDPKSEGTGVGLALVKRIIEVHGGRVWVESDLGKGATFYFTLPEATETCESRETEKN